MPSYETLELVLESERPVAQVWLKRPELRNAFNPLMIAELSACFSELAGLEAARLRAVVLGGRGDFFCSGGDLGWMQSMAAQGPEENLADARRLADMLAAVDACPVPLLARVQGGAFGGGLGLLACCDYVACSMDCQFAFSEVRLGIAPATIAPYVVAKLGYSAARSLLLSGERFTGPVAWHLGLVHDLADGEAPDNPIERKLSQLLMAGPFAARATKKLLRELGGAGAHNPELLEATSRLIAELRASPEGQEGLRAFLEKRKPSWLA